MPSELDRSQRSRRAVLEAMDRAYRGEPVSLPLDLSDTVHGIDEPWPLRMKPKEHTSDPPVAVEITQVDCDTPDPALVTVHMQVLGVPTVVIVGNRHRPHERTRFRFVTGVHPWQLTDVEAWAMLMALGDAVKGGISA